MEVCNNPDILKVIEFIWTLLKIAFFIIPIGLILMITIDFSKNVIAGKDDEMKKNLKIIIKRIIYCVCIFLVPTIVEFVCTLLGDTGVSYVECINNANTEYIENRIVEIANETLATAKTEMTSYAVLEAENAISKIEDEELKAELQAELEPIKTAVKEMEATQNDEEKDNGLSINGSSSNSKFLIKTDHPNSDYTGYKIELTDSQRLKVARSIFGEMESADYEGYAAFCQYIRDYIDYGKINRTYDNLGSFWLKRGGSLSESYNLEWFKENKPEVLEAIEYIFDNGNSAFQGVVGGYYAKADELYSKNYASPYDYMLAVTGHDTHSKYHDLWTVNGTGGSYTTFYICYPGYGPDATVRKNITN